MLSRDDFCVYCLCDMIWYCMRHFVLLIEMSVQLMECLLWEKHFICEFSIDFCLSTWFMELFGVFFFTPSWTQTLLLLQGRRYWTAVVPAALSETNCLVSNPHVENSLPDCAIVWGVISHNTPYKLSSQLYCLQTHVLFVHHLQETWSFAKSPVDDSNLCFPPQCNCHVCCHECVQFIAHVNLH